MGVVGVYGTIAQKQALQYKWSSNKIQQLRWGSHPSHMVDGEKTQRTSCFLVLSRRFTLHNDNNVGNWEKYHPDAQGMLKILTRYLLQPSRKVSSRSHYLRSRSSDKSIVRWKWFVKWQKSWKAAGGRLDIAMWLHSQGFFDTFLGPIWLILAETIAEI